MKSFLDTIMSDVVQLNYIVANHVTLGGMLFETLPVTNDEIYRAYRIASDLYDYDTSSTGSTDIYVYLPKLDMVTPREDIFLRQLPESQRSFARHPPPRGSVSFAGLTRPRFGPSQSMDLAEVVHDTGGDGHPLPRGTVPARRNGWLVVHIARDLFQRIFAETAWTPDSLQLVYHPDGVIAASENVATWRDRGGGPPVCWRRECWMGSRWAKPRYARAPALRRGRPVLRSLGRAPCTCTASPALRYTILALVVAWSLPGC